MIGIRGMVDSAGRHLYVPGGRLRVTMGPAHSQIPMQRIPKLIPGMPE